MNKRVFSILSLFIILFIFTIGCEVDSDNNPEIDDIDNITVEDEDYTGPDDIGTMIEIPEGEFWMGNNEVVDSKNLDSDKPYHLVMLSKYKIDKYEVTAGEYLKCVEAGVCNNDNEDEPHFSCFYDDISNLMNTKKEKHPINFVSWYGANAYCKWVGKRLPTEAEWEKAARGTEGFKYPWGNDPEVDCDYAIITHSENIDMYGDYGCGKRSTWVVGSKKKGVSQYGVYDMIGNVAEWVDDWYEAFYYKHSPLNDPKGPEKGSFKILRGFSYMSIAGNYDINTYYRSPSYPNDDYRSFFGFRCALSE